MGVMDYDMTETFGRGMRCKMDTMFYKVTTIAVWKGNKGTRITIIVVI